MLEQLSIAIVVLALATVITQPDGVARDVVDVIEVNHVYDDDGRPVFTQQIFWVWSERESRYHVRAWRMVKEAAQLPRRDHVHGGYVAQWLDGQTLRAVHALSIRETWTQYDVEMLERETLPVEQRTPLK